MTMTVVPLYSVSVDDNDSSKNILCWSPFPVDAAAIRSEV